VNLEKRIARAQKNYSKFLKPEESITWADPFYLVLTDARLVSFAPVTMRAWTSTEQVITFSAPLDEIDADSVAIAKSKKLEIHLVSGQTELVSGTVFSSDDAAEFTEFLVRAMQGPRPISQTQMITSENRAQLDQEIKDEKKRNKREQEAEFEAKYGKVVVSEPFATKWITIYSKGYVKVSAGMGIVKGSVEKLLDIFGETDITRKTGLGRAVGAVFTMGANIALSPSQRGNVYLTIATDRETYSIAWERPDQGSIRTMNRIVSAGKAALARSTVEANGSAAAKVTDIPQNDLPTQLANLAQLRDSGVLSDEEFEKAKAKLLG
jgi:hypothetical protein